MNEMQYNNIVIKLERYYNKLSNDERSEFLSNLNKYINDFLYSDHVRELIIYKRYNDILKLKRKKNFYKLIEYLKISMRID